MERHHIVGPGSGQLPCSSEDGSVNMGEMVSSPVPESPHYRITFFFGPEAVDQDGRQWRCVFNVKKRSWKGGIQVVVDLTSDQVARGRQACDLGTWAEGVVSAVPIEERAALAQRIDELFIQALCAWKLDLVAQQGLSQENQTVPADACSNQFESAADSIRPRIISYLCTELDLDDSVDLGRWPQTS